jgi:predicted enzyme related to lactoylglutathione lyase
MKRVTGIGGIFFKANDPQKLLEWYAKHLGITPRPDGSVSFSWVTEDSKPGSTIWAPFPRDTKYFEPSSAPFMVNYRVENLDQLIEELGLEGVTIDSKREEGEFGKFAWIMDPEGNRIELWEPAVGL